MQGAQPLCIVLISPKIGGSSGLIVEQIAAPSPPETWRMARNDKFEGWDASHGQALPRLVPPIRACRGAKPSGCVTESQIRNPMRVQGVVPAEGLGVSPNFLFCSPKNGGQRGLTSEQIAAPSPPETRRMARNDSKAAAGCCRRSEGAPELRAICCQVMAHGLRAGRGGCMQALGDSIAEPVR